MVRRLLHRNRKAGGMKERVSLRNKVAVLIENNTRFVVEKLRAMSQTEDNPAIRKVMASYELRLSMYHRHTQHGEVDSEILTSVFSFGFQAERDNIHAMLEAGRISRETAKRNAAQYFVAGGAAEKGVFLKNAIFEFVI